MLTALLSLQGALPAQLPFFLQLKPAVSMSLKHPPRRSNSLTAAVTATLAATVTATATATVAAKGLCLAQAT